jgi:hypothetical protein
MPPGKPINHCAGSQSFPDNYDGEFTRCSECGRKMKLHVNGKLPHHNRRL